MVDTRKKIREYILVKFLDEEKSPDTPVDIDIVPKRWLHYDKKLKVCVTRFPSPPYSSKIIRDLQKRVEHLQEPDCEWEEYPITIVGHASKYNYNYLLKITFALLTNVVV